jgi:hypothetical protein
MENRLYRPAFARLAGVVSCARATFLDLRRLSVRGVEARKSVQSDLGWRFVSSNRLDLGASAACASTLIANFDLRSRKRNR